MNVVGVPVFQCPLPMLFNDKRPSSQSWGKQIGWRMQETEKSGINLWGKLKPPMVCTATGKRDQFPMS